MNRLSSGWSSRDDLSMQSRTWLARSGKIGMGLLIVLASVGLRVRNLDRDSLWFDEVVTMRLARTSGPNELIALLCQIDGSRAPLHPLLLQAWVRAFGHSELAGRSFSTLCGLLTIYLVYVLGRRFFDESTGIWGAWLAAVCPPLVYYSQEARMYAWLVLLTCLSWLLFDHFRQPASRWMMLLYGATLTGLAYCHPLGLFMIAAHGVAFLAVRRSLMLRLRFWVLIQLGVLLSIAPWIPRYLDHGTDFPMPRYSIRYLLAVPIEYVGGNSLFLLACVLIIAGGFLSARVKSAPRPSAETILLSWLIVPPVAMYVYSWIGRPIFGPPRYHLFIAPAYLILLARGLCKLPRLLRVSLAAVGLYLSLTLIEANVYSQVAKADWRGLAQWISHQGARGGASGDDSKFVVIVHPSDPRFPRAQIEAARYYLEPSTTVLPGGSEATEAAIRRELSNGATVLDIRCLSADRAIRPLPSPSSSAIPPPLYGLTISRP